MRYSIESVDNGYIITTRAEGAAPYKCIYTDLVELLKHIQDLEEPGSRYDDNRIYIIRAPGDKNDNFTSVHADVIWGKDE